MKSPWAPTTASNRTRSTACGVRGRGHRPIPSIRSTILSTGIGSNGSIASKYDVDSFDFEVLRGAERTLLRRNPVVVVELNHALAKRNQSAGRGAGLAGATRLSQGARARSRKLRAAKGAGCLPGLGSHASLELLFQRPLPTDERMTGRGRRRRGFLRQGRRAAEWRVARMRPKQNQWLDRGRLARKVGLRIGCFARMAGSASGSTHLQRHAQCADRNAGHQMELCARAQAGCAGAGQHADDRSRRRGHRGQAGHRRLRRGLHRDFARRNGLWRPCPNPSASSSRCKARISVILSFAASPSTAPGRFSRSPASRREQAFRPDQESAARRGLRFVVN